MHQRDPLSFQPLPFADRRPRGLFIDRWGTLLELPEKGPCTRPEHLRFHEGALDALFRAQRSGWLLYSIGNEDAVAEGRLSDQAWERLRAEIEGRLASHGIELRRFYACLDHPKGKGVHQQDSVFLLPNTGVFHHARHNDEIALEKSWVIGDSTLELVAGWRAGVRTASVRSGLALSDRKFGVEPEVTGLDLTDVLLSLVEAQTLLRW